MALRGPRRSVHAMTIPPAPSAVATGSIWPPEAVQTGTPSATHAAADRAATPVAAVASRNTMVGKNARGLMGKDASRKRMGRGCSLREVYAVNAHGSRRRHAKAQGMSPILISYAYESDAN